MSYSIPVPFDILLRPIKYVSVEELQQALLAEYDGWPFSEPELTATALGSGQRFKNVNMGASGLGYTVLTKGLVCFGQPRDGASCFMACAEFNYDPSLDRPTIKRGVLDDDGELIWQPSTSGDGLVALTFAGNAFFAVYHTVAGGRIDTSFDGETWGRHNAFPLPSEDGEANIGGAVAALDLSPDDIPDDKVYVYASVGQALVRTPEDADPPYTMGIVPNLSWASSGNAVTWISKHNSGVDDGIGASDFLLGTAGLNQACSVAGGAGLFVAPAYTKRIETTGDIPRTAIIPTAAIATSRDGAAWSPTPLPSATDNSAGMAVVFVKTTATTGVFYCTTTNSTEDNTDTNSTLYTSFDGRAWQKIKTSDNSHFYWTLSAVAKDLSATTIVHL